MPTETLGNVQHRNVALDELVTDGRFNRPVSFNAVNKIASGFNARAFAAIVVWERKNGELVILDGQHRVEAARQVGVPEAAKCLPAVVHKNLTLDKAAELFVKLNATRLVSAYDKFHALLTAGDPETEDISRIVLAHGLGVGRSTADGTISAVAALREVYGLGEPQGVVLGHALATLYAAWGPTSEAYKSALLRGVGLYFHAHRDAEPKALAEMLVRGPGAPINLLGWAKTKAGTQRMPLAQAIAEVIEERVVNRRARPRKTG